MRFSDHESIFVIPSLLPVPPGLEAALADELSLVGASCIQPVQGGVGFHGSFTIGYHVNLESRIASRVLLQLDRAEYHSEQDVYRFSLGIPWWEWFSAKQTIKVKVQAKGCPLKSLDYVTLRVKDAVCDAFFKKKRVRPNVDTRTPDVQIMGFLDEKSVTVYLDMSGEPLFKRGWPQSKTEAPLRENLAAGLLKLSGWTGDQTLFDPMCGSGTILIEAAQMAKRVAPGLGRRFAFQKFRGFDAHLWERICQASIDKQHTSVPIALFGSDRNDRALQVARRNLEDLNLQEVIRLRQADVLDVLPPSSPGILMANPPYGIRIGEYADLAQFLSEIW